MRKSQWKNFVNDRIRNHVFDYLIVHCKNNDEARHLSSNRLRQASYLINLEPNVARVIFRGRLRMYDIKVNSKKKMARTHSLHFAKM